MKTTDAANAIDQLLPSRWRFVVLSAANASLLLHNANSVSSTISLLCCKSAKTKISNIYLNDFNATVFLIPLNKYCFVDLDVGSTHFCNFRNGTF